MSWEEAETNQHKALRYRLDHEAITAFLKQYPAHKLDRFEVVAAPADTTMHIEGVRVKARLDAELQWTDRNGEAFSGGVILFPSRSEGARKNIKDRTFTMAALVHWTLVSRHSNICPKPRLCTVWDMSEESLTESPKTYSRLQNRIEAACREVRARWEVVSPPTDYDGPSP